TTAAADSSPRHTLPIASRRWPCFIDCTSLLSPSTHARSPRPANCASLIAPPFFPPQPTLDRLTPLTLLHQFHLPRRDRPVSPRASTCPPSPAGSAHDTVARVPRAAPS